MKKIQTIGIIGGTGKMGQFFQSFFSHRGFKVLISGRSTELTHKDLAEKSDLLIFSVPIDKTVEIIESVLPFISEDTVLFDLTSLKKPVLDIMLQSKAKEVVGGHPMFGPTTPIAGQVFVLSPGRGEKALVFLEKLFSEADAKVKIVDALKHDELMAVVQGLTHFTDIALARALSKTGMSLDEFLEFQSPAYRLKLIMMGRILAQDAGLYGNIQIQNPQILEVLKLLFTSHEELFRIIQEKNLDAFCTYFTESAQYLGPFAETAMKESDLIIETMFQKKVLYSGESQKADIAILGPQNTYSDFACDEVFGERKSRKYCRTITEAFENVDKELCEYALVPVENKLAGPVHETYDAFWHFDRVEAIAEIELKITHVLACLDEKSLKDISIIRSHPQALTQCSRFLEKHRNIKRIAVASTADAVLQLGKGSAAIVPKKAAEKACLQILDDDIANSQENFTRFYLIHKKAKVASKDGISLQEKIKRTSIAFELLNTKSGALLKILQFFAQKNINLFKLESKPVGDDGDTIFFVDIEGGLTKSDQNELQKEVAILKVFGAVKKFI